MRGITINILRSILFLKNNTDFLNKNGGEFYIVSSKIKKRRSENLNWILPLAPEHTFNMT